MRMQRYLVSVGLIVVAGICFAACARHVPKGGTTPAVSEAATTAPAPAGPSKDAPSGKFSYPPAGIEISYPGGWKQTEIQGYEWTIEPADAPGNGDPWVALDVPTLPMHLPGMIPIGEVEKGYLEDLKKEAGKLDIKELTPPKLPDAKERMVRAAWQKDGKSMQQTALLLVHADHVYIIRSRSQTKDEQSTRQAFDTVTQSIRWIKKK